MNVVFLFRFEASAERAAGSGVCVWVCGGGGLAAGTAAAADLHSTGWFSCVIKRIGECFCRSTCVPLILALDLKARLTAMRNGAGYSSVRLAWRRLGYTSRGVEYQRESSGHPREMGIYICTTCTL